MKFAFVSENVESSFMEFTFCALNVISNLINFFILLFNRMREGQKNLQEAQDQERRKRESSHDSITKGITFFYLVLI